MTTPAKPVPAEEHEDLLSRDSVGARLVDLGIAPGSAFQLLAQARQRGSTKVPLAPGHGRGTIYCTSGHYSFEED